MIKGFWIKAVLLENQTDILMFCDANIQNAFLSICLCACALSVSSLPVSFLWIRENY